MSAPIAVIDQVADGVVALISAAWTPALPDAVTAVDLPFDDLPEIDGIQVQVFTGTYSDNGSVTRAPEFDLQYTITVLTFSKYTGAGDPPASFTRPLKQFVEQTIVNTLKDPTRVAIAVTTVNGSSYVWPLRLDEVISYDVSKLKYQGLFWSAVTFTFQGTLPI